MRAKAHGRTGAAALALVLAICLGVLVPPCPRLEAQQPALSPPAVPRRDSARATALLKRPWLRPVASLLVPGSGQLAAGQPRGLGYLVAELWLVSRALAAGRRGRQSADQFRELIFDVARRPYTSQRVDGPWDYYEAAEKFVESGSYNANPGGPFTPEPDTTTFNGALWRLAARTFFVNPDSTPSPLSPAYQAALAFYQARAVTDAYRYSWRGARLEQDVYRSQIRTSDDAFRARTNYFGALVLNHLVSLVDALITLRLGHRPAGLPAIEVGPGTDSAVFLWSVDF